MNTTVTTDETTNSTEENAGSQLARIREKKGFTKEYVAGKLHLRVKIIELLEADDYMQMPEPVFIMGYLRAYAKLLGVAPDPYILVFNNKYSLEKKPEKALWQSKRESNTGEFIVRWVTGMVAIAAIVAVSFWWQKNKEEQPYFAAKNNTVTTPTVDANPKINAKEQVSAKSDSDFKLTTLSKMQSMFFSSADEDSAEKQSE